MAWVSDNHVRCPRKRDGKVPIDISKYMLEKLAVPLNDHKLAGMSFNLP